MTLNLYKNLMPGVSLLAACCSSAQTVAPANSKDVTEVVISGQQNASDWVRAESQHFIVFSDAKQQDVSQLLDKLERFDYLLRLYTKADANTANAQKILYQFGSVKVFKVKIEKEEYEKILSL